MFLILKKLKRNFYGYEKKLPKSIRKFIRKEKTRIRREVLDVEKQKSLIKELYQKFSTKKTTLN